MPLPFGVKNSGNTCHFNGALQLVLHMFRVGNLAPHGEGEICSHAIDSCLACDAYELSRLTPSPGDNDRILELVTRLLNAVYTRQGWSRGRMQDMNESYLCLIDCINEACAPTLEESTGVAPTATPLQWATRYTVESCVRNCSCRHEAAPRLSTEEILQVEVEGFSDIASAIAASLKTDVLDGDDKYLCAECKGKVKAQREHSITAWPKLLVVCQKLFAFDGGVRTKKNDNLSFPDTLNLQSMVADKHMPDKQAVRAEVQTRTSLPSPVCDVVVECLPGKPVYELAAVLTHWCGPTRLSQGMGEALLNNAMQVAMNAPHDGEDDEQWCTDVVEHYCSQKARRLDSPFYNDTPNQGANNKKTSRVKAADIVCHPSSFATAASGEEKLPMPSDDSEDDDTTTTGFAAAILRAAKKRKDELAAARREEAQRVAVAAEARRKEAAAQREAEEKLESKMTAEQKQARDEAVAQAAARDRVAANMSGSMAANRVLLAQDVSAQADARAEVQDGGLRRSARPRPVVSMGAGEVAALNAKAIRESAAAAAAQPRGQVNSKKRNATRSKVKGATASAKRARRS